MFGFVKPYETDLSQEEKDRYRAVYCGLCHTLNEKFGILGRMGLNNDMTFLTLLLQSLYEPEEESVMNRCPPHPAKKHREITSEFTSYTADITVALMYHKALDDWEDEKKTRSRAFAAMLKKHYEAVKARRSPQCEAIESCIAGIHEVEKNGDAPPENAANLSGRMLEAVFCPRNDFFTPGLRQIGFGLGKFIYMMDAAVDFDRDAHAGCYNSLRAFGVAPEDAGELLRIPLGIAAEAFETLPLVSDLNLMRNILYSGVWQEYNAVMTEKAGDNHGD